jgi:hypothetical protein
MVTTTIRIINGERIVRLARTDELMGEPIRKALKALAVIVEKSAKEETPVDRGRLRSSITHALDVRPVPLFATVGTDVAYARDVHDGRKPGTMPPTSALRVWASRHGFAVSTRARISRRTGKPITEPALYALANSIARRGIKPRPFLTNALSKNISNIRTFFQNAGRDIERLWSQGA